MLAKEEEGKDLGASFDIRRSLQSDLNTNGVASSQEHAGQQVFTEGTFHVEAEVARIQEVQFVDQGELSDIRPAELQPKPSFGSVSFGAQNKFLVDSDDKAASEKLNISARNYEFANSVVSIIDIQEVRDKVPASPATATKHELKEAHF